MLGRTKIQRRPYKYNACSFFQMVKLRVEDLWLFSNELSFSVSSVGTEGSSMLKNKMLGFKEPYDE